MVQEPVPQRRKPAESLKPRAKEWLQRRAEEMTRSGKSRHVGPFGGPVAAVALALAMGSIAAAAPAENVGGFVVPAQPAVPGFQQVQPIGASAMPASPSSSRSPAFVSNNAIVGRYSILRTGGKDTGCMLTLENGGKGRSGGKAFLSPACRDQGVVIFDPTGWQIVKGQLVLIARKGHKTRLDLQVDGTWMKDSKEGKPLILKKM